MKQKNGCVWLVGAGCGGRDWMTLRGLELLRTCDTLVYDDLIAGELLNEAPETAERLYMGKRSGHHAAPQEEICALLIEKARAGRQVVRLKGGDPFVFGRGGEEALALRRAGIPFQVVPGISSAIAIPGEAGIPVTHRGVSRSVHIITAHTAGTADGLPEDLDQLARLHGTLVFLMGLHQLSRIAARLTAAGLPPETPAAVASGGNSPHPGTVRGTLADIAARTAEAGIRAPAVIIVGGVAALELTSPQSRPLRGVSVGLTGTDEVTGKLSEALGRLGAATFLAGRSVLRPLPVSFDWRRLTEGGVHWLVFTSANGVRLFLAQLARGRIDLRRLAHCRLAVIGRATGAVLEKAGLYPDLCPEVFTTEALADVLCRTVQPGEDICLFRSALGSRALYERLAAAFPVREVPLYTLQADPETARRAAPRLEEADYLTFSSASGVELYFKAHGAIPKRAVCVCIGEVTARALSARTDRPFLTAGESSCQGIADAILEDRRRSEG